MCIMQVARLRGEQSAVPYKRLPLQSEKGNSMTEEELLNNLMLKVSAIAKLKDELAYMNKVQTALLDSKSKVDREVFDKAELLLWKHITYLNDRLAESTKAKFDF